jgi:hypothetical protein
LVELSAADREGAWLALDGARPAAGGTGLFGSQGLSLLFEAGLQGPFGQAGGGRLGNLLHGVEIDVEPGSGVAEGASGDDFAPLGSEVTQFLELLGGKLASRHGASCARVTG